MPRNSHTHIQTHTDTQLHKIQSESRICTCLAYFNLVIEVWFKALAPAASKHDAKRS